VVTPTEPGCVCRPTHSTRHNRQTLAGLETAARRAFIRHVYGRLKDRKTEDFVDHGEVIAATAITRYQQ
jgi:hypothetical protein